MMAPLTSDLPMVAIAGASGFVGTHLRRALGGPWAWKAITRSQALHGVYDAPTATTWHHADLYSLPQVEAALAGCRWGVYLVHSMVPSTRLMQGHFRDTDLLLADNFAKAARANGLEHLVYLGGLLPTDGGDLSPHLASRAEVEEVLRHSGLPVTVLRAGLIVGPGGSSTRMLINLVRRLPWMVLPRWTRCQTASIDIREVVRAVEITLPQPAQFSGTYDLATHTPTTYEGMIRQTASVLGKKLRLIKLPLNLLRLSRFWVQLFSGVPASLVGPLMESLTHELRARDNPLLQQLRIGATSFDDSIRKALQPDLSPTDNPRSGGHRQVQRHVRIESRVRSVQRMPLPPGWDAAQVTEAYRQWLTRSSLMTLLAERGDHGGLRFALSFPRLVLLDLTPTPRSEGCPVRRAFYISGGLLAQPVTPPGRFEFRIFPEQGCVIAAIHGFRPRLPWYLYQFTQAQIHLWVMQGFSRHLRRQISTHHANLPRPPPNIK